MGRSRLAWVGSTVAPWGIALGFLVSITAQAGQEPGWTGSLVAQEARADRPSPVREAFLASTFACRRDPLRSTATHPILEASLTLGAPEDLAAIPDEIEPNPAVKQGQVDVPRDRPHRQGRSVHRPSSRLRRAIGDAPVAVRRRTRPRTGPRIRAARRRRRRRRRGEPAATLPFGDGATPAVPLDLALNSSTPTPSDGKLIVVAARAARADDGGGADPTSDGKPNYAALIDPKDFGAADALPRPRRSISSRAASPSRARPPSRRSCSTACAAASFPPTSAPSSIRTATIPSPASSRSPAKANRCASRSPAPWATATRIAQAGRQRRQLQSEGRRGAQLSRQLRLSVLGGLSCGASTASATHIFYAMRGGLNWAPGALNGRGDLPPLQAQAQTTNAAPAVAR